MRYCLVIIYFILHYTFCFSQQEKKAIRDGNLLYSKGKFNEAEKKYTEALQKKSDNIKGNFNLGDAYYKQGKFKEAAEQFDVVGNKKWSKDSLALAYHNLGNSYLKSRKFEESVKAYKQALKNNPKDEDTRYNLAYAQKMIQQQQQNKDNKKDKDKNKENKDKKEKNEENKKDQKKEENEKQEKQQNKLSKEDAERLLQALNNDEKNIQNKLKKQKGKASNIQIEKDW